MTNKYYQKHKEILQIEAREYYQNLTEEEKGKRRNKARERYQNLTEEKKEKSVSIIVNVIKIFLENKNEAS